ncbi:unnamed protein product [Protopolystoma xenopodis]|uniref:Uncharacterized protein n=1 Tax=Protopolystoma xenopodis TaxID=117903 RepID=A0A3S5A4I2_9PLAT|nr:unnamed protein product [Protopolystoma xenopodis]
MASCKAKKIQGGVSTPSVPLGADCEVYCPTRSGISSSPCLTKSALNAMSAPCLREASPHKLPWSNTTTDKKKIESAFKTEQVAVTGFVSRSQATNFPPTTTMKKKKSKIPKSTPAPATSMETECMNIRAIIDMLLSNSMNHTHVLNIIHCECLSFYVFCLILFRMLPWNHA